MPGETYCRWHDPARQEENRRLREKGGRNRSNEARAQKLLKAGIDSLGGLNRFLAVAAYETYQGKLDPKRLNAIANAVGKIKDLSIATEYGEQVAEIRDELARLRGERSA
jgi:hypothetical protein